LCTDLSLSAQEVLSRYTRRWAVEVDHLYLKLRLGLGDFRLRRYEDVTSPTTVPVGGRFCFFCSTCLEKRHKRKSTLSQPLLFYRMPALGISASIISMAIV
jgi:hypothetical protein